MHSRIKSEIIALARATPNEICGFICLDQCGPFLFPCRNVASVPTEEFAIDPQDYIAALAAGQLLGIYHSHPAAASFSPEDLDYATETALPHYLYSVPDDQWSEYLPPTYEPLLEGLNWALGFQDCYSSPRSYYRRHFQRYLSDYDRDESFCHEEQQVIMNSFEKEGFRKVPLTELALHDVLLFRSEKVLPQHFGVLCGPNQFLHHPRGGLSCREMLTDRWMSRLICAFRLKTHSVLA